MRCSCFVGIGAAGNRIAAGNFRTGKRHRPAQGNFQSLQTDCHGCSLLRSRRCVPARALLWASSRAALAPCAAARALARPRAALGVGGGPPHQRLALLVVHRGADLLVLHLLLRRAAGGQIIGDDACAARGAGRRAQQRCVGPEPRDVGTEQGLHQRVGRKSGGRPWKSGGRPSARWTVRRIVLWTDPTVRDHRRPTVRDHRRPTVRNHRRHF